MYSTGSWGATKSFSYSKGVLGLFGGELGLFGEGGSCIIGIKANELVQPEK